AARKFEVLFLYDSWDEFVMDHLRTFESKDIKGAERSDIAIESAEKKDGEFTPEQAENLAKWTKEVLKDSVNQVRASKRLVESPAVVVEQEGSLTTSMRRILKAMKKEGAPEPEIKFDLEINPRHPIITRLEQIRANDAALAEKVTEQIFDNARVAAGVLEDP